MVTAAPKITPAQLLALLEAVIQEAPALNYGVALGEDDLRWLARAEALLGAAQSLADLADFRVARKSLGGYMHSRSDVLAPLHNAYYRIELLAPEISRGAYIPAGDTWNGYAALVKIIQRECDDLLLVDPYLSSALFMDFAPHAVARMGVRCLTSKRTEQHAGLAASAQKWRADALGAEKSVQVRYAPSGALHDRLIIIDGVEAWLISQSLKDIAKRSPASVSRADTELARLKAEHYNSIWEAAIPVV